MTFSHRSTSSAAWWAAAAALTACSPLTTLPEPPVAGTESARESASASQGAPAPAEPPVLAAPAAPVEAPVPTAVAQPPAEAPRASRESEWDWADMWTEGDEAAVTEAPRKKKKHDD